MSKIRKIVGKIGNEWWDKLADESDNIEMSDKKETTANKKERFDYFIKQSFLKGNLYLPYLPSLKLITPNDFGWYIKRYDRTYDRYFSKQVKIKEYLSEEIQKAYDEGMGNEFKNGKFYSVASSSRFAVSSFSMGNKNNNKIELLNKIKINDQLREVKIKLEKDLNVLKKNNDSELISNPQMDVFFDCGEKYYFEVKCHEILDNHKSIKLRYDYLNAKYFDYVFKGDIKTLEKKEDGNGVFLAKGREFLTSKDFGCEIYISHFDFKKFICHLLGILNDKKPNETVHFYYLFYKNNEFPESKSLYDELEKELDEIIIKFGEFFNNNKIDFGYFYNDSFNTLPEIRVRNKPLKNS